MKTWLPPETTLRKIRCGKAALASREADYVRVFARPSVKTTYAVISTLRYQLEST